MHRFLNSKRQITLNLLLMVGVMLSAIPTLSQDGNGEGEPVELSILWFADAEEETGELRRLLEEFEAANPAITVNIEPTTNREINTRIEQLTRAGTPPDLARTTEPGRFKEYLLDLRPYLSQPDVWEQNFQPEFLASLRDNPEDGGLHGYPTDLTVSAPFINRTLWEEAGVPIPSDNSDEITWEEWTKAATQVQAALSTSNRRVYALAIDQSGHRFWGPSLSLCASYIDLDNPTSGEITIDTPGFRTAATLLRDWHDNNLVPHEIWTGDSDTLVPATEFFIDSQVAFYFSGNWQLSRFQNDIGEQFEWEVVPNPVGPCGQTGMIGGSTMVAFEGTESPEAVGKLMDFLTEYDNLARFYRENKFLPGHVIMNQTGLDYPDLVEELQQFQQEIERVDPESIILQYRPDSSTIHNAIRAGLVQMLQNDLSLDETIALIEAEING